MTESEKAATPERSIINVYTCPECGWRAVTRDREEGTTPFLIRCEGRRCDAAVWPICRSALYRVDQSLEPTHEWYRPLSTSERKILKNRAIRKHVQKGGLCLRKLAVH